MTGEWEKRANRHSALDAESITKPSMDSCFRRNDEENSEPASCENRGMTQIRHSELDSESQKQELLGKKQGRLRVKVSNDGSVHLVLT